MTEKQAPYTPLFEKLGYHFTCITRLEEALTHSSAARHACKAHNERLEFLGDRVVGLVLADLLFERFPNAKEGDLAKRHAALVSREALLQIGTTLGLESYLKRSSSFSKYATRYKQSSLSDACEALLAALYLESGYETTQKVIRTLWAPLLEQVTQTPEDPKSALQEWAQAHQKGLPHYMLQKKTGPEHDPLFQIKVCVGEDLQATGTASSKREAERHAADHLMKLIAGSGQKKTP